MEEISVRCSGGAVGISVESAQELSRRLRSSDVPSPSVGTAASDLERAAASAPGGGPVVLHGTEEQALAMVIDAWAEQEELPADVGALRGVLLDPPSP